MFRAWKTSEGFTLQREVKDDNGVKHVHFSTPIPSREIESFFQAIYPFYREYISKNVTVLTQDLRPVGIIEDPDGKDFYYITMDTYIMLCDDTPGRPNKPDKWDTEALTRLVSFNGDRADLRTVLALARRRGIQGIAAMINFFLDEETKGRETNP